MDLVIFVVLCGIVVLFFKKFSSFIYFVAMTDIFLRIVTFIKIELFKGEIYAILDKYVPANIPAILANYSEGILYTILLWLYVIGYIIFETYIFKTFFRNV